MPCKITWKDNLLEWEFTGDISTEEFHNVNKGPYGDARWDDLKYLIADFTNAKSVDLPEMEIYLIQFMDKAAALSNPSLKIATVTKNKDIRKIAETYGEDSPWKCRVFETVEQACLWLGI